MRSYCKWCFLRESSKGYFKREFWVSYAFLCIYLFGDLVISISLLAHQLLFSIYGQTSTINTSFSQHKLYVLSRINYALAKGQCIIKSCPKAIDLENKEGPLCWEFLRIAAFIYFYKVFCSLPGNWNVSRS